MIDEYACVIVHMEVRVLVLSFHQIPGIELESSGLAVGIFTH